MRSERAPARGITKNPTTLAISRSLRAKLLDRPSTAVV